MWWADFVSSHNIKDRQTILPEALTGAGFVTLAVDSITTRLGSNFGNRSMPTGRLSR